MAIQEQLEILKQGVDIWNSWRRQRPAIFIDLSEADLSFADLSGTILIGANLIKANLVGANLITTNLSEADLSFTDLTKANLTRANLTDANLSGANLTEANFTKANLTGADLTGATLRKTHLKEALLNGSFLWNADLWSADLTGANLGYADLSGADLTKANLSGADLTEANLSGANLTETNLSGANLNRATVGQTVFGNLDLRTVKGLETIFQYAPSTIGTNTLERSKGNIPDTFLRGAGLSPTFIKYTHLLVQSPLQYYTCFISYSSKDQIFAERLRTDLLGKGVNCWFALHDMRIGDKIRPRIDESIKQYDKLLIILSEHSVKSQWVEHEVETAIGKELEDSPNVLFPIRLDNAIMESKTGWASHIKLTRNIGDFTQWEYHSYYDKALQRLLRDLQPSDK